MSQVLTTDQGVAFLRTPEAAFQGLPDFDHAPAYITFEGLRLAYVDVGPRDGPVALLMHGMPTWSFLNRHEADEDLEVAVLVEELSEGVEHGGGR